MPEAHVKKLNHRWTVGGVRPPDNRIWVWGPLAPCAGNQTAASRCSVHWVAFEVRFVVTDGPHLGPTCPAELGDLHCLRSWPSTSIAGYCILMPNKFPRIYWDVQKNQLSLQYIHPGWMISCHFSLTIWKTEWPWLWAMSSASHSWGPGGKDSAGLCRSVP